MFLRSLLLASLCFGMSWALHAESLYVFVPSEVRANVIEDAIKKSCSGMDVTAFGRAKDFVKQTKKQPPTAMLTLLPVIDSTGYFKTILKGARNGSTEEDYVFVTKDKAIDLSEVAGKKVGVVDLLGRKPMSEFVSQLLQTDVKLKRVSKIEDLLPLLSFGAADILFVSESVYENIKSKSKLNLVATRLNVRVGLVSAALNKDNASKNVADCIKKFGGDINGILGVDQWQAL